MIVLSPRLNSILLNINQKKLSNGEILLLSKAISDELPLMTDETDSVRYFTLSHRTFIDNVIYKLSEYTYIDDEQINTIYNLIDSFVLWRYNIAFEPPNILFRNDPNLVVDDISCLPRYVDTSYLCAVGDVVKKADFLYYAFRQLAKECKGALNNVSR